MKLNQNINENQRKWRKSAKTAKIVVANRLFPYVNKSYYPYFLIRCWLQLLALTSGLVTMRSMVKNHRAKKLHSQKSEQCLSCFLIAKKWRTKNLFPKAKHTQKNFTYKFCYLLKRTACVRPEVWKNHSFSLLQDNAPVHTAIIVQQSLAKKNRVWLCWCTRPFVPTWNVYEFVCKSIIFPSYQYKMEKQWTNLFQLVGKVTKIIMGEKTFFNFFMASDLCAELES